MTGVGRKVWWSALLVSALALGGALLLRLQGGESARATKQNEQSETQVVQVVRAQRSTLTLSARHAGELDSDAAEIAAQTAGLLESVSVRIGDAVRAGQALAQVDPSELRQQLLEARAQVRAAQAAGARVSAELGAASGELARTEPLLAEQLVGAQELDVLRARVLGLEAELRAAEAQQQEAQARVALLQDQIRRSRLTAPFDGAVAERYLDPGATVQPGTQVLRIVKAGPPRIRFRVPERDVQRVAAGMPLAVTTQATGDARFQGKVDRLSAEIARSDRSLAVEGVLDDASSQLKPGMYAQVLLTYGKLENVIVVPESSIVDRIDADGVTSSGVYLAKDGHARFAAVSVLGRSQGLSAVSGVAEGAQVVTAGQKSLRDGLPLRIEGP